MRQSKSSIWERSTGSSAALVGLFTGVLTFGSAAFAQGRGGGTVVGTGADPFTNVTTAVCNVAEWAQGPVGIAVGFLVLVGGIIAMQVASRDALPMMGRALLGTALLIGAGTAFGAIVTPSGCAGGTTSLPPIRVISVVNTSTQLEFAAQLDSLI